MSYSAPPFTIGFNWQYLLDFLARHAAQGKFRWNSRTSRAPGSCGPADDKLKYRYVVMPMRV